MPIALLTTSCVNPFDAGSADALMSYDSVPLSSCECGGGIGCAHESIAVSFERSRVWWTHDQTALQFARTQYDRAIQDLLVLLGESPRLISQDDWKSPIRTRVVREP
jgi:hypothetical protein